MTKWTKERYDSISKYLKENVDPPTIIANMGITSKQFDAACARMAKTRLESGKTPMEVFDETGIPMSIITRYTSIKKQTHEHIEQLPETLNSDAKLDIIIGELARIGEKINILERLVNTAKYN